MQIGIGLKLGAGRLPVGFSPNHLSPLLGLEADYGIGIADGQPIPSWTSKEGLGIAFTQADADKQPLFDADGINGNPCVLFDGTNDLLVHASGAILSGASGTAIAVFSQVATGNVFQRLLATSSESVATRFLSFVSRGNTTNPHLNILQRNADIQDAIDGSDTVNASTVYCAVWESDGSAYFMRLNGNPQTIEVDGGANSGDWFDDTTDRVNVTIGALKHTSETNPFGGRLGMFYIFPKLSAGNLALMSAYIQSRYGAAA